MTEFVPETAVQSPEERAQEMDRAFFATHPDTLEYRRPSIPGELGPGLYLETGRTYVATLAGELMRVGNFVAFTDSDALHVALLPTWSPWAEKPEEIPEDIRERAEWTRSPEGRAAWVVLEAEEREAA